MQSPPNNRNIGGNPNVWSPSGRPPSPGPGPRPPNPGPRPPNPGPYPRPYPPRPYPDRYPYPYPVPYPYYPYRYPNTYLYPVITPLPVVNPTPIIINPDPVIINPAPIVGAYAVLLPSNPNFVNAIEATKTIVAFRFGPLAEFHIIQAEIQVVNGINYRISCWVYMEGRVFQQTFVTNDRYAL